MTTIYHTYDMTELSQRELVDPDLWTSLVKRVEASGEFNMEFGDRTPEERHTLAASIMNEALGFLAYCAAHPEQAASPSKLVDIGWHTFILDTRSYRAWCQRTAGDFVDHVPGDVAGADPRTTMEAMRTHGIPVNESLWEPPVATVDANKCAWNGCNRCSADATSA